MFISLLDFTVKCFTKWLDWTAKRHLIELASELQYGHLNAIYSILIRNDLVCVTLIVGRNISELLRQIIPQT